MTLLRMPAARWVVALAAGAAAAGAAAGAGAGAGAAAGETVPNLTIQAAKTTLLDLARVGKLLIAVGERGVVVRSEDGGQTWRGRLSPTSRTLTAVAFVDDQVGVAVGHGGTILRTEDAGLTWAAVPVQEAGRDAVLGVTALRNGKLVAFGAFGMYLVSADQGKTWRRQSVIADNFERHISRVIETRKALMLVGETGVIARSVDGGEHWATLKTPYEGSYFGILEMKSGALLAFGMRGNVYRSTDEGATWQRVPFQTQATINGGTVAADGRVVLAGNRGLLATSSDDGRTFALAAAPEGTSIAQARLLDDGVLAYVGSMAAGRIKADSIPGGTPALAAR